MRVAVEIWHADLETHMAELDALQALLDAPERGRMDRYARPEDARRFAIGRGLLRRLLGLYLDMDGARVPLTVGAWGKPEVAGDLAFNLSHSGGKLLFGFARHAQIGVDVESIDAALPTDALIGEILAPAEIAALGPVPEQERRAALYRGWTRKEAAAKAGGLGLGIAFPDILAAADRAEACPVTVHGKVWTVRDIDLGAAYAAALAVQGVVGLDVTIRSVSSPR